MRIIKYALLTIGVMLLSSIGFIYHTEGADAFSTKIVEIEESHLIPGKKIKHILINSKSTDVTLIPHLQEDIQVELKGEVSEKLKDAFVLTIEEFNNSLHVDLDRLTRPSFTVFAINKETKLTVRVPSKMYEDIAVESTSGDIIATNLMSDTLSLSAKSGDIKGENLSGISAFSLEATSGDILLKKMTNSYSIDFKSTSGDGNIDMPGFLFEEMSEHRILGRYGNDEQKIIIRTTSGDFKLK